MAPQLVEIGYREAFGTPWHRCGTPITGKVTAKEAAVSTHMDYEIRKVALYADMEGLLIPSPSADLYSNYSGEWKYLNTVKRADKYEIVQNMEIADLLDDGGEQALSTIFDVDTLGILSDGKRTFYCLRMPEASVKIGVDGSDDYIAHLLIFNDFSGNGTLQVAISDTRVVCYNTLLRAVADAEKKGTLWTFPHRSQPLAQLKYRVELERGVQEERKNFYAELEAWALRPMSDKEMASFVQAVYPDPPKPKKMKRAEYATDDMNPDVVAPILAMAADAKQVWEAGKERAKDNRTGLEGRIAEYVGSHNSGPTLYWAFNGATDWINWRVERGTIADVGESVMYNERRKELDRALESARKVFNPQYNRKGSKN